MADTRKQRNQMLVWQFDARTYHKLSREDI